MRQQSKPNAKYFIQELLIVAQSQSLGIRASEIGGRKKAASNIKISKWWESRESSVEVHQKTSLGLLVTWTSEDNSLKASSKPEAKLCISGERELCGWTAKIKGDGLALVPGLHL